MSTFTRSALLVALGVLALLVTTTVQAGPTRPISCAADGTALVARPRCSSDPKVAAQYVIPPPPFRARVVSVRRWKMPADEPVGGGPAYKRLYRVTFDVLKGNAVLPAGHRYSQYSYVTRKTTTAAWCFQKGGSGP